jgi:hypothetical protein
MAASGIVTAQLAALDSVDDDTRRKTTTKSPRTKMLGRGSSGISRRIINRRFKWEGEASDDNLNEFTEHGLSKKANSDWWDSLSKGCSKPAKNAGRYIINFLPFGLDDDSVRPGILQRSHVAGNVDSINYFIKRVLFIERFSNPQITVGFKYHVVQHGSLILEALSPRRALEGSRHCPYEVIGSIRSFV